MTLPTTLTNTFVYLEQQPLLWLFLTLLVYILASKLHALSNKNAFLNPVAISAALIIAFLVLTDVPYTHYFEGAQFIHFLLGPAVVLLALPIAIHIRSVWRARLAVFLSLLTCVFVSVISAIIIGKCVGLDEKMLATLAPKNATAPIAMGISEKIGGITSITAIMTIITAIFGAGIVTPLFNILKLKDWRARGFALGASCHGIGTAHAFSVNEVAGTYATIGMALSGVFSALIIPLLFHILV